ncbi:DEAD/DEAH box helicase [Actinocrinis puniceicyclus]|uniref:Probable helicase HelY n=1 Tax=Actinocrinis puniceicyclus TaxID=977794 RepID=A0A8J8BA27_9ACTN|nr:DEAD/DEAH box helicase [Actinocrinis puniceicyclus]MBS2961643.1 DEAD/DEAH box helicase [Actinocrinis puniceicyclus]
MTSPAERFAAARRRQAEERTQLSGFAKLYSFGLDQFQLDGCRALEEGRGVLVAAPTGAGKTVVGEFAVHLALAQGRKCFYTTPIKALSNQKYADLVKRHGADRVGLLTGDNSINGDAPVVVMTTEVLRNMLYAGSSALDGLGYVVMDEVHYLADRFRGAVWEEVIIHLPESVQLVSLSATVSNAEEFGEWLETVRGETQIIVSEHRPVPLWQHVLAGGKLYDLYAGADPHEADVARVNPELVRFAREEERFGFSPRTGARGGRPRRMPPPPSRVDVIERLDASGLLPAITFIFSRAGCDAAVQQFLRSGVRLLTEQQRVRVRAHVSARCAQLPAEDLNILGYHDFADGLERGVAAHHAGMLPTFKEIVEELFAAGLVKAVFATETLALGINMPARSVVLEALVKWNGEFHADITPGEYTQLTGRAGRRGIDIEGHAVVVWRPGLDPRALAGLASTRTYPLRSSFKPSYNMAVNLVGQVGKVRARALLESSFAQFQADKAVVGLTRQLRRNQEALDGYREAMSCHLGDFDEYMGLRRALSEREAELSRQGATQRRAAAASALETLKTGDIIVVPSGRKAGLAVVLDPGLDAGRDGPRPRVLTAERQVVTLSLLDFPVPVEPTGWMRVPKNFNAKSPQARRDLAATLRDKAGFADGEKPPRPRRERSAAAEDADVARLRRALRAHPCHGCEDRENHARWAERHARLERETEGLDRRVKGRTHSIARTFDRVCSVLTVLGYLDGERVTAEGRRLARIYSELDLLAAECLRERVWDGLSPAELASAVSLLVYESRSAEDSGPPRLPKGLAREAIERTVRLWISVHDLEGDHAVDFQREPDAGFAWAAYQWAEGHRLDKVLEECALPAGDFVRWCKQLIDLLGQLADAAGTMAQQSPDSARIRETAFAAVELLRRGVVAYSSVS